MIFALAAVLVFLTFFGMPLYAAFAGAALLGYYVADVNFAAITVEIYRIADTPLLIALPMFTFCGYLLSESRSSHRLVELTQSLVGSVRGGLAVVAFVSCALFTAFTGACGVTIVALGALLLPAMLQQRYPEKFTLGLITTSGSLGLLLPPSLPLILYGIISQQMGVGEPFTLTQLFMAGLLPALLMIVALSAWSLFTLRNEPLPTQAFSFPRLGKAVWDAKWELPMPLVVLGCIYGGWLAVSEVAALVAFYLLIVEVFIYREVPIRVLPKVIKESMTMVGGLLLILALSMAFTHSFLPPSAMAEKSTDLLQLAAPVASVQPEVRGSSPAWTFAVASIMKYTLSTPEPAPSSAVPFTEPIPPPTQVESAGALTATLALCVSTKTVRVIVVCLPAMSVAVTE